MGHVGAYVGRRVGRREGRDVGRLVGRLVGRGVLGRRVGAAVLCTGDLTGDPMAWSGCIDGDSDGLCVAIIVVAVPTTSS